MNAVTRQSSPRSVFADQPHQWPRRNVLLGMAAAGVVACDEQNNQQTSSEERRMWRMTTCWPKNFPGLGTTAQYLADYITAASGGRLTVTLFAAGEIVPAFEAIDAVSRGVVEMGHGSPYYWKGKLAACQFLTSMPFGPDAQEQTAWYIQGGGQEIADTLYAELGCKFFPAGNTCVQMGGWFKRTIDTINDFSGLKIRMPGLGGEVIKALGANVVNLPAGEVALALQSGAIDAVDWAGPYNDLAFGLHKYARYYYYPGWHEPCGTLDCFINLKEWASLPDDLQEIVATACAAANQISTAEFTARNASSLEKLVDQHGVDTRPFSQDVLNQLAITSRNVMTDIANADPQSAEIYHSLTTFLQTIRRWSENSEAAFLEAREHALAP